MLIGPARLVLLAAVIACIMLVAARIDYHNQAMAKCQERYSFDTCHYALNR